MLNKILSKPIQAFVASLFGIKLAIVTSLAAPHGDLWANYTVSQNGNVQTGNFLGSLNIAQAPWIHSHMANSKFYLPEEHVQEEGAWLYLPRKSNAPEIISIAVAFQNLDFAMLHVQLSLSANLEVHWGTSPETLNHQTESSPTAGQSEHIVNLGDLPPNETIYYKIVAVTPQGPTSQSSVKSFTTQGVTMAQEVSRHGITWRFDKAYPVGQFANGDWWVVGPVKIIGIDPVPGPIPEEEDIADVIDHNQYHTTSLRADRRWKNGSMIVSLQNGYHQAYDSRNANYNPALRFQAGDTLEQGQSLISTESHTPETGYPAQVIYHDLMWQSEKNESRVLKTAAVLTCLDSIPSGDMLRPAYVEPSNGLEKEAYHLRDIQWDKLKRLALPEFGILPPDQHPDWSAYERYFERVWLDHIGGHWYDQRFVPSENQAYYGRDYARLYGAASLMVHLDVPKTEKLTLLTRLLQLGIDLRGMALQGAAWSEGGGLTSGRKWPILFTSMMLIEDYSYDLPDDAVFHEDVQTYWGEGWHGQRALYQMVYHTQPRLTYMEKTPDQWDSWDTSGMLGGKSWAIRSEEYRANTTVRAWPAQTLAALLMNAKELWGHDAYFEIVDDWMRKEDLYADQRQGFPRPHPTINPYPAIEGLDPAIVSLWSYAFETTAYEPFVTQMWHTYRNSDAVPSQPHGDHHRKWDPFTNGQPRDLNRWTPNDRIRWVPNQIPNGL